MLSCRVFCLTLSSCLAASHHPLGLPANSPNPFTINTYEKSISNSFRMNTYRKTGEGGSPTPTLVHCSFALSFTLLPRAATQPSSFQASAHSLQEQPGCTQTILYSEGFLRGAKLALGPLRQFVLCPCCQNARKYPLRFTPSAHCEGPKEPAVQDFSYDTHFDL